MRASSISVGCSAVLVVFCSKSHAGFTDSHVVLTDNATLGVETFESPSINHLGDVVIRATNSADNLRRRTIALLYSRNDTGTIHTLTQHLVSQHRNASSNPVINDSRQIVSANYFEFGTVERFDYNPSVQTFETPLLIAEWDLFGTTPRPFRDIAFSVSVDDAGTVSFWNEADGANGNIPGVFAGNSEITVPFSAFVANDLPSFDSVDRYVDSSTAGWLFHGERSFADAGVYRSEKLGGPSLAVATNQSGFLITGERPSINNDGTVAFYGENQVGLSGVFLTYDNGVTFVLTNNAGTTPAAVSRDEKVSLNNRNQVAFLGTNSDGMQALYATNLGSTREIIAVGDRILQQDASTEVQSLALYDALMDSGQLVYKAVTMNGREHIVLTNRGYTQGVLADSPVNVPWAGTPYLLRSDPQSPISQPGNPNYDPNKTIGSEGCNLTSTVNVLSFFGVETTPGDFQEWLIGRHIAHTGTHTPGSRYVTIKNDFNHWIVEEFSETFYEPGRKIVQWSHIHQDATTNRDTIVSELQAGRPVKIQVPNRTEPGGHFVVAYALKDPTAAAVSVNNADILIHDPGHPTRRIANQRSIHTLEDYEMLLQDISSNFAGTDWLNSAIVVPGRAPKQRVHLYRAYDSPEVAPARWYANINSPVEVVLTDPTGDRLGFDPDVGAFNEISGGLYFEEAPYMSLDSDEVVWLNDEPVKNLNIIDPMPGLYSLEIIGTGDGPYEINFGDMGKVNFDIDRLAGDITLGQRVFVDLNITLDVLVSGDYNSDGSVNAADYVVWRDHLGGSVSLPGDATPGLVSQDDYDVWKMNFGSTTGSAFQVTVPEPAGGVMMIAAMLGFSLHGGRVES